MIKFFAICSKSYVKKANHLCSKDTYQGHYFQFVILHLNAARILNNSNCTASFPYISNFNSYIQVYMEQFYISLLVCIRICQKTCHGGLQMGLTLKSSSTNANWYKMFIKVFKNKSKKKIK